MESEYTKQLRDAAIAYLSMPTSTNRRALAVLVGFYEPSTIDGAFKAARGILAWEEGDEAPEDAIRRMRDEP